MNPAPRLLAALLAASLLGNAALLFRVSQVSASASREADRPASESATTAESSASDPAMAEAQTAIALHRALSATSLAEFRDLLVAAGIEPKLRREMLRLLLQHRYADRFHELYTDQADLAQTPWWRNPDYRALNSPAAQRERQEAGQELQQRFEADLARLTGEDPRRLDLAENPWLKRQYAGIPAEKAEALFRLQQDYDELEQQVRMGGMEFQLPADVEKLRLLRAERERDIAALLTPEERSAWEMRSSPTADRTRDLATRYQATEDEYRRIYALQKAFDERFNFDDGDPDPASPADWEGQSAAQKELQKAIREIVGEERYEAARRENDSDYTLARSAVERLGLPAETAGTIHDLRTPVAEESRRIFSDPALPAEQKRAALAKLAADTRAKVEQVLGPEAAELYFKRGGMNWLDYLNGGSPVTITENGVEPGERVGREPEPMPVPTILVD